MSVFSQPIAGATFADPEWRQKKLLADPSITVTELFLCLERYLKLRGTNDLVQLLKCTKGKTENDSATKWGNVFLELKELLLDLIKLCPNTVLPRQKLVSALQKLNEDQDRRWHFTNRTLFTAATEVHKVIRTVLSKLREIAKSKDAFHRFVQKVSVQRYPYN